MATEQQFRDEVVKQALACVGIREHGSNRGAEVEAIQHEGHGAKGDAWCSEFNCAMLRRAAHVLGIQPLPFTPSPGCDKTAADAVHAGRLKPAEQAQPGDLLMLGIPKAHGIDYYHTGVVVHNLGDQLLTCEGNTNDNGSPEGNGVYLKHRQFHPGFRAIDACRLTA